MMNHKLFSTDQWFQIAPVQYGLSMFLGLLGVFHIGHDLLNYTGMSLDNRAYVIAMVGAVISCAGARYRLGKKSGGG